MIFAMDYTFFFSFCYIYDQLFYLIREARRKQIVITCAMIPLFIHSRRDRSFSFLFIATTVYIHE